MPRQVARDLTNHVPLSGLAATAQLICLELSELERERCYKPCSTHHLLSSTLDILEFLSKYYRSSSIKYCSPTGKETVSVVWFKGTGYFLLLVIDIYLIHGYRSLFSYCVIYVY
jgi:hypothetical protein